MGGCGEQRILRAVPSRFWSSEGSHEEPSSRMGAFKGSFEGSFEGYCRSLHSPSDSPPPQRCLLLLDAELHVLP